MVVLNRIYTRTGDAGETALGNGARVAKHSLRVSAYGTVDEVNATLGLARLHADGMLEAGLARVQNDLAVRVFPRSARPSALAGLRNQLSRNTRR
jgi:cob(I)alamin adenosyltransferase